MKKLTKIKKIKLLVAIISILIYIGNFFVATVSVNMACVMLVPCFFVTLAFCVLSFFETGGEKSVKKSSNAVYENKQYDIPPKVVFSYGAKIPGQLYEEVEIYRQNGVWKYSFITMEHQFVSCGDSGDVPVEFLKNDEVDVDMLLAYIAENYKYMDSLQKFKKDDKRGDNSDKNKLEEQGIQ